MSIANQPYELLANRVHKQFVVDPEITMGALNELEGKMDAIRTHKNTLTDEELEKAYRELGDQELETNLTSMRRTLHQVILRAPDGGAKVAGKIARMEAEKERRSKAWLRQAVKDQADSIAERTEDNPGALAGNGKAAQENNPFRNTRAAGGAPTSPVRDRTLDESGNWQAPERVRRMPQRPMMSQGAKQVVAVQTGPGRRRQTGAVVPAAPQSGSRPGSLKGQLLLSTSRRGELQQQQHGKEKALSGQECLSCNRHRSNGEEYPGVGYICDECHDAQGAGGSGADQGRRRTREAATSYIEEDDFDPDTRNYRQPRLKEGGLPTNNFYGKMDASGPARPQSRGAAQDSGEQTFSRTRQGAATRKRIVEQDNEPITLDDTDDEEAGPGPGSLADAAQPRRSQRSNAFKGPMQRFEGLKALYPPCGGPGAVEITPADMARLNPEEFLNDTIIDFFMRHIWEHLPEEVKARCYFFNSFFWKKLTEKSGLSSTLDNGPRGPVAAANHERVKKWTKGLDIFAMDFLFVPIHDHLHWSLLIVCNPGADPEDTSRTPCMLHLDSMTGGHSTPGLKKAISNFLTQEWDRKVSEGGESVPAQWAAAQPDAPPRAFELQAKKVKLPMQDNYCDCGLFLLTYVDFFTHGLPASLRLTIHQRRPLDADELASLSDYPLFLHHKWFYPGNASKLREHIRYLLLKLFVEQVPEVQLQSRGDALAEALQDINRYEEGPDRYQGPADYLPQGLERREDHKRELERQRREKQRQAEEKQQQQQRKAAEARERSEARRGLSQRDSQPGSTGAAGPDDPASRRRKAADAAERRLGGTQNSDELENFEIDLASSPREGSEFPSNPFNDFRLHSKVQDGPLVAYNSSREQSPDNVSKDGEWQSKGNSSAGRRKLVLEPSSDEDGGNDVQCTKELDSIDLGGASGSGATPAPEEPAGRVETPAMAEKYESYFRLHKRFSSDGDRLSHVEVEMLRREPSGRKGLIVQDPGKRKTFDSEASAYEWMDLCLSARPAPLAAWKPAPVRCASKQDDYGIEEWPGNASPPAVRSPSMLMGSPRGRVSDRTRNAPGRSDKLQGEASGRSVRDCGLSGADSKRHKPAAAADEAHDLTGDEDKADEAGLAAQITPPPNDFAAASRESEEIIASVERTMAWVEDRSRPEAPAATSGFPSWVLQTPAAASKASMDDALAKAVMLELPGDEPAKTGRQPSGASGLLEQAPMATAWNRGTARLRNIIQAALPVSLKFKAQKKQPSVAHMDGFTTTEEEDKSDTAGAMAEADEPSSRAEIDLTSDSGAADSPAQQQPGSSYQEAATPLDAAGMQPPTAPGPSEQLPANAGGPGSAIGDYAVDLDEKGRMKRREKKRRYKNNRKQRRGGSSQQPVPHSQEPNGFASSDESVEDVDVGSPSRPGNDPILADDFEAGPASPAARAPPQQSLSALEEADRQFAEKLQQEEEPTCMTSKMSDMHIDEYEAPKDEDYIPGREGGKRSKRKGKGSPKSSPKKPKPLRHVAADACTAAAVARVRNSPSVGRRQMPMGAYFPRVDPLSRDQ